MKRARGSRLLARSNPVLGGLPSVPDSFHHQDKNLVHFVRLGIFFGSLHWFNPLSDIDVVLSDLDADHLCRGFLPWLGYCEVVLFSGESFPYVHAPGHHGNLVLT